MTTGYRPVGAANVTIKEIAARLGVSHSTVSRALNDHRSTSARTKTLVRDMADTLGYIANTPARAMRRAQSSMVGLIIPDIQNDFYATVAKVMAEHCGRENLQLVLAVTEDDPEIEFRHVRALREALAAGVVTTLSSSCRPDTLRLLNGTVHLQLLRMHPNCPSDFVGVDDRGGVYEATRHLIGLGHRRIAFIGGPKGVSTTSERYAGFRAALFEAGLPAERMLAEFGPPRPSFGRDATARVLADRPVWTGLVIASPQITIGAIEALDAARHRIPDDLSLVSYGDAPWFRLWRSPISAIDLPAGDVAATTASLLFRRIRDRAAGVEAPIKPIHVALSSHLVPRGTTGAPMAATV